MVVYSITKEFCQQANCFQRLRTFKSQQIAMIGGLKREFPSFQTWVCDNDFETIKWGLQSLWVWYRDNFLTLSFEIKLWTHINGDWWVWLLYFVFVLYFLLYLCGWQREIFFRNSAQVEVTILSRPYSRGAPIPLLQHQTAMSPKQNGFFFYCFFVIFFAAKDKYVPRMIIFFRKIVTLVASWCGDLPPSTFDTSVNPLFVFCDLLDLDRFFFLVVVSILSCFLKKV